MPRVKLVVALDTADIYDAQVIKILSALSEVERKNVLVSSLLYWSRSPAFQLNDRLAQHSDKLDQLLGMLSSGQGIGNPVRTHQAPPQAPTIAPSQPALRIAPAPASGQGPAISTPLESFSDGMDEAFGDLFEESVK